MTPIPHLKKSDKDWQHPSRVSRFSSKKQDGRKQSLRSPVHVGKRGNAPLMRVFLRRAIYFIIGIGVLGMLTGLGALAFVSRDLPDPNQLIERSVPLSTKIYDRTGETLLYEIHGNQKRTIIQLEELPEYVKWATIVTEDKNFYNHPGFDLKGIMRAIVINVLRGERAQGGSTITQQLIKNSLLTTEKKYSRKMKEWILAYRLEQKFDKDEILQLYFNEIPYGSTAYGIESAAQTYFDKSAREVTLAEAAILAALPKAPTYYSPYGSHKDELIARQRRVLDDLFELDHITSEEAEEAKTQELVFKERRENITAPHFVIYVQELLTETYGEQLVEQGGLRVITTLDAPMQKLAEEIIDEKLPELEEQWEATNAALTALAPTTGHILAMVGSRDFFDNDRDGQVNVALRPRQPGSSFKPIVYTAGFMQDYTPDTALFDVETIFKTDTDNYEPKNYDLEERGPVTVREALQQSLNIPAVKMLYLTGIENVLTLAESLGYTTLADRSRFGLSLVLGGGEVTLLEHVGAYAVLAKEGARTHTPTPLIRVEDKDGAILYEYKEEKEKILDPEIARLITSVLTDNDARAPAFGQANLLTLPGRQVAAKTGTTNDYRDAWLIGYTPSLAVGVWAGNNDNTPMQRGGGGSSVAGPIWNAFMRAALEETPVETFTSPQTLEVDKPILKGKAQVTLKVDRISGKLATEHTPEHLIEERTFIEPHSILHYVNKNDPRGPMPADPSSDPQYENWEEGVVRWVEENELEGEMPPTEPDDVHDPAIAPSIAFDGLENNAKIEGDRLRASVKLHAPLGIDRVEYFVNDVLVDVSRFWPFDLNTVIAGWPSGYYTLRAVVYDIAENIAYVEQIVNLHIAAEKPLLRWIFPTNQSVLRGDEFSLYLEFELGYPGVIHELSISANPEAEEKESFTIQHFTDTAFNSTARALWETSPEPGTYILTARVFNEFGGKLGEEAVIIRVE